MISISTKVQLKLVLENKVCTKHNNISNISQDFLVQFYEMNRQCAQLYERKVSKSGLQQNVEKKENILRSGNVILNSCVEKIFKKKEYIGKIYNDSKRKERVVIIKFAELMHSHDTASKQIMQITKNVNDKKLLEGTIKELQIIKSAQCSEPYSVAPIIDDTRKDMNNSSLASTSTYHSNVPRLKQTMSKNLIASTLKYFKSSHIRLKTTGNRKSMPKVISFESYDNASTKDVSKTDLKLTDSKKMDKKINTQLVMTQENRSKKSPEKRVQFSSEIEKTHFNDEIKNYTNTTKIDVINIVRKDIIRSSVHSKIYAPESLQKATTAKVEKINELMETESYGTNSSYLSPFYNDYFAANEDIAQNDRSGYDDNDNSKDNIE